MFRLQNKLVCKCDDFCYRNLREYCDHIELAILVEAGNPTQLPLIPYDSEYVGNTEFGSIMPVSYPEFGRKIIIYSVLPYPSGRFAFVHLSRSSTGIKVICSQHRGKKGCPCRKAIYDYLEDVDILKNPPANEPDEWDKDIGFADPTELYGVSRNFISTKTIPVPKKYKTLDDNVEGEEDYYKFQNPRSIPEKLSPSAVNCDCGYVFQEDDLCLQQSNATLFCMDSAYSVAIYSKYCGACDKGISFDGMDQHIMNVDNKKLIHHSIFTNFQNLRLATNMPAYAYVNMIHDAYADHNSPLPFVTSPTFDKYFKSFCQLQAFWGRLKCRGCEKTGKLPDMIMFDGTSQILRQEQIKNTISPKASNACNDVVVKIQSQLNKIQKVYITNIKLRESVEDYLIASKWRIYTWDTETNRKKLPLNRLVRDLNKNGYKELSEFMQFVEEYRTSFSSTLMRNIGDLLRILSSSAILNGIIKGEAVGALIDYSSDNWPEIKDIVINYSPHICMIHEGFVQEINELPPSWIQLIKHISNKCHQMITKMCAARESQPCAAKATPADQTIFTNSTVSGTHYEYEAVATRPTHDIRSEKYKKKKVPKNMRADEDDSDVPNANCNKYYMEFSQMSNGIIVVLCIEHHEVMGYHVLREPESVNDIFSLIMMIYPGNTAPNLILCDNACQLHKYAMYREPVKFKNTLCLNDEFHGLGHKCGPFYNIKYLKDSLSRFAFLNDSEIEQVNSKLKKIRLSCSYMNLPSFDFAVTQQLELISRQSIVKRAPRT